MLKGGDDNAAVAEGAPALIAAGEDASTSETSCSSFTSELVPLPLLLLVPSSGAAGGGAARQGATGTNRGAGAAGGVATATTWDCEAKWIGGISTDGSLLCGATATAAVTGAD